MEHVVGKAARGKAQREIKATKCEECGKEGGKLHRHHDDLRKPLDVRILCPACHASAHKDKKESLSMSKDRKKGFMLYAGGNPESMGGGRYSKDVLKVGAYVHPATGQIIDITPERIRMHAREAARWLENGNEIPHPEGHNTDASKNLGDWPGPFFEHGDTLTGVVVPKAARAIRGYNDKTMNRVSAFIDFDVTDPKGNHYDEVITHICATPVPVITGQDDPVKLSREQDDSGGEPLFLFQEAKAKHVSKGVGLALSSLADVCKPKPRTVATALGDLARFVKSGKK